MAGTLSPGPSPTQITPRSCHESLRLPSTPAGSAASSARVHARRNGDRRVHGRRSRNPCGSAVSRLHHSAEHPQCRLRTDVRPHVRAQRSRETQCVRHDEQDRDLDGRLEGCRRGDHVEAASGALPEHHDHDGQFVGRLSPEWPCIRPRPVSPSTTPPARPASLRGACPSIPAAARNPWRGHAHDDDRTDKPQATSCSRSWSRS